MSSGAEQWRRSVPAWHDRHRRRAAGQPARPAPPSTSAPAPGRAPGPGDRAARDGQAPRDQRQRPVPDRDRQGPAVGEQAVRHRQPARGLGRRAAGGRPGGGPRGEEGFFSLQRAGDHETLELESGVPGAAHRRVVPGVEFLHVEYQPGACSSREGTFMRHAGQEFGYLLSGRLRVDVGFDRHELGPATRSASPRPPRTGSATTATSRPTPSGASSAAMPMFSST